MSQHHGPRFEPCSLFDLASENIGDAAQLGMTKLVLSHVLHHRSTCAGAELRAFGDDNDREVASALMPLANRFGDLVHIERPLWNQNRVRAAGNAAIQRNPSRIPP